jgi:hypothetical protein
VTWNGNTVERKPGWGLAVVSLGQCALIVVWLAPAFSGHLSLTGKAALGLLGVLGLGFVASFWLWAIHATRSPAPVKAGRLRFAFDRRSLEGEAERARFWVRVHLLCWLGIFLTIPTIAVALRRGLLG